jgi:3-methyladenine DNA glycosylase/8-oxoguanine DNA glycosylase
VTSAAAGERTFAAPSPYDFDESLRFLPFGPYDPSTRRGPAVVWKAAHLPPGPVTLQLARRGETLVARAWGPAAGWALERADAVLGLRDEPSAFRPAPVPLARLARRWHGLHLPRCPWVFETLCQYVLQQRVSFREAARAWRRLVERRAAPAPGPPGLLLPLAPREWLRLTSEDFRRAGVDGQRAAARAAPSVDAAFEDAADAAQARLAGVPGCGPWTVAITAGFGLGDPDAVPVGDLHLPSQVAWALAGEPRAGDARMLALLEPFRGHRFRVLRLLLASGRLHLGRGPRAAPRSGNRPPPGALSS